MLWLAQVSADTTYLSGVALPMILLGIGQGFTLSPLTVAGITGVRAEDAGAASGMVNVSHQMGGSLGLSILAVVFAMVHTSATADAAILAHRIASVFLGAALMLSVAMVVVWWLIVRARVVQAQVAQ
jgi:hypothetical protein